MYNILYICVYKYMYRYVHAYHTWIQRLGCSMKSTVPPLEERPGRRPLGATGGPTKQRRYYTYYIILYIHIWYMSKFILPKGALSKIRLSTSRCDLNLVVVCIKWDGRLGNDASQEPFRKDSTDRLTPRGFVPPRKVSAYQDLDQKLDT